MIGLLPQPEHCTTRPAKSTTTNDSPGKDPVIWSRPTSQLYVRAYLTRSWRWPSTSVWTKKDSVGAESTDLLVTLAAFVSGNSFKNSNEIKLNLTGRFDSRAAFASWILMNILLVTVPRYGGYGMIATGGLMLLTNLTYYLNIPSRPLMIRFEGSVLSFSFGWCFWLVLIAGKFDQSGHFHCNEWRRFFANPQVSCVPCPDR